MQINTGDRHTTRLGREEVCPAASEQELTEGLCLFATAVATVVKELNAFVVKRVAKHHGGYVAMPDRP